MPNDTNTSNLPAAEFYTPEEMIGIYRSYFERGKKNNVRFFLGFKSGKEDTNSGMRRTLREKNQMFLAYNNGITADAEYGNARVPVASYALAYLNYITLGDIDLLKVWDVQEVPESIKPALDNLCDKVKTELEVSAQAAKKSVLSVSKNKNVYSDLKNRDLGFERDSVSSIIG